MASLRHGRAGRRGLARRNTSTQWEVLRCEGASVHFEGLVALDRVDLQLARGEILGLIGPNGAGKTTLINVLSAFQRLTGGRVCLDEVDVTHWSPHAVARVGIARTFQNVRAFRDLTVLENVATAASAGPGVSSRVAFRNAGEMLANFDLTSRAGLRASALSHGEQRRLTIARALAGRPTFLLLDEPAAGLDEAETDGLIEVLKQLNRDHGLGMLVVEHDMRMIMSLCERIQVLNYGKTISVGTPQQVRDDPAVLAAYFRSEGADRSAGS